MKIQQFEEILARTLDDGRFSRSERRAIAVSVDDEDLDADALGWRTPRPVAEGRACAVEFERLWAQYQW